MSDFDSSGGCILPVRGMFTRSRVVGMRWLDGRLQIATREEDARHNQGETVWHDVPVIATPAPSGTEKEN